MQRDKERAFHLTQLFIEDHVKAEIIKTHTAVLFIRKHREKAVFPGGLPGLLADLFILPPAFGMGGNFSGDPFANAVAEHLVLFFKNASFDHGTSLIGMVGLGIRVANSSAICPVRHALFNEGFDALFAVIGL